MHTRVHIQHWHVHTLHCVLENKELVCILFGVNQNVRLKLLFYAFESHTRQTLACLPKLWTSKGIFHGKTHTPKQHPPTRKQHMQTSERCHKHQKHSYKGRLSVGRPASPLRLYKPLGTLAAQIIPKPCWSYRHYKPVSLIICEWLIESYFQAVSGWNQTFLVTIIYLFLGNNRLFLAYI